MLGGTGTLLGPSLNAQFDMVVDFLKVHLPQFAKSVLNADIDNENGLNSRLSRFISNAAAQEIFSAERERMEDETKGNSPAVDIGIYLKVEDTGTDPPLITVFEGKRLTTTFHKKRRREYVIGHKKGGKDIQFKVFGNIAIGWITTPIIAGVISFFALFFVNNVFQQQVANNITEKTAISNTVEFEDKQEIAPRVNAFFID